MSAAILQSRRRFLAGLGAGAGGLVLSGCDRLNASDGFRSALTEVDRLHLPAQRLLTNRVALVREYRPDEMSPRFRTNGNTMPGSAEYRAHLANGFADWRLPVTGLVARPLSLSLAQLRAMPTRSQITRHDCVEGWSAIGQWSGPQLGGILRLAGLSPRAQYVVFHCADRFGDAPYYESIDLTDAMHPQTILAWGMNGQALPVGHGAPIRLRVERQLGYKNAKFIMGVEARERIDDLYGGKGGYWEDASGYNWYAGI